MSEEISSQSNCAHNLAVMTRSQTRKEAEKQRKVEDAEKIRLLTKRKLRVILQNKPGNCVTYKMRLGNPRKKNPKPKPTHQIVLILRMQVLR